VVFGVVDCMAGSLYRHTDSLLHDSIHRNSPTLADSSPATGRGILRLSSELALSTMLVRKDTSIENFANRSQRTIFGAVREL
jgi:hypothetical protein